MELLDLIALISRFLSAIVGFLIMFSYSKRYKQSKQESSSPNIYFLGQSLFFACLSLILLAVAVQDLLYRNNFISTDLTDYTFPDYETKGELLLFMQNMVRPIYIILEIVALIIFAFQIYPLEVIIGNKKPITKLSMISALLLIPIYIPALTYTYYAIGAELLCYLVLIIDFLMNFYLSAKIIKVSAGDLRRRAILNLIGFMVLLIGLVWSMRVTWTRSIMALFGVQDVSLEWDVLLGSLLMILASYTMYSGLSKENST